MAKKRKRKSLGYPAIQRFVVVGCEGRKRGGKRVYTNVADAMTVARRCTRNTKGRVDVLYGLPGNEGRIASCQERKCATPGGKAILLRKLYDAEQRGPAAAAFDEQVQWRKGKGGSGKVPAKAKKTKAKKKKLAPWKAALIARAKARRAAR